MSIEKYIKYRYIILILLLVFFVATTIVYFNISSKEQSGSKILSDLNADVKSYKMIRKNFRLDPLSLEKRKKISNLIDLEIQKYKSTRGISNISVFYYDLSTLTSISIGENEKYVPASLLKLPLMISALKVLELSPGIMTKKYTFTTDYAEGIEPSITGSKTLEIGKTYNFFEIIQYAIIYSDNRAAMFLRHLLIKYNLEVYRELFVNSGMNVPEDIEAKSMEYKIGPAEYANFMNILYNCNYLNPKYSEYALNILKDVEFNDGIKKSIPKDVEVSHKFGAFGNGKYFEMHECGIVYAKDYPYILCIMSRGESFEKLSGAISGMSKIIYEEVIK